MAAAKDSDGGGALTSSPDLAERSRRFRSTFVKAIAFASIAYCILNVGTYLTSGVQQHLAIYPALGVVVGFVCLGMLRAGRLGQAMNTMFIGNSLLLAAAMIVDGYQPLRGVGLMLFVILVLLYAFLEGPKRGFFYTMLCISGCSVATLGDGLPKEVVFLVISLEGFALIIAWVCGSYAQQYSQSNERMLADRLEEMAHIVRQAEQVADGNLELSDETAPVMRDMLVGLRPLVERATTSVRVLATATTEVSALSTQQAEGATQQASAVQQTSVTLEELGESSAAIAKAATSALDSARDTVVTHRKAQELMQALLRQESQINEVMEIIKEIARRSEIIALNAALEGSRAGEAGRGFTLVANEIQNLAMGTSENVARVQTIVTNVRRATDASVIAIDDATLLATSTEKQARRIQRVVEAQTQSTTEVIGAMQDISRVTQGFADASVDTLAAMRDLTALSAELEKSVERFKL